jgi:cell division protein FtsB
MGVTSVDHCHIDRAGARIATHRDGQEALAEARRQILNEGGHWSDVPHGWSFHTLQLLFEARQVDGVRGEERSNERCAARCREEQGVPKSLRCYRVGDEQRARERERHAVRLAFNSRTLAPVHVHAMLETPVNHTTALLERTLPIAMLSLALVAVPVLVLEPEGLPRLRGLQRELDDVTVENDDLRREVDRLRVEVRELRDDPAAIERIARGELGMVRKSEVVFQFGK